MLGTGEHTFFAPPEGIAGLTPHGRPNVRGEPLQRVRPPRLIADGLGRSLGFRKIGVLEVNQSEA